MPRAPGARRLPVGFKAERQNQMMVVSLRAGNPPMGGGWT